MSFFDLGVTGRKEFTSIHLGQNQWVCGLIGILLASLPSVIVHAAPELQVRAHIYDKDSQKKKLLFDYKSESEAQGTLRILTNTFTSPDGKVAVIEKTELGSSNELKSYHLSQKQVGSEGQVDVKKGEAIFTFTRDGKTKTSTEKIGDDFTVGPTLLTKLRSRWPDILKGDKLKIRFAVLDRQETVGFELFKENDTQIDGQKAVVIKMKPSSFVIAALVDPLRFYMTPDGARLIELHGRVQPKKEVDGKFKDLDAVTVYEDIK